MGFYAGYWYEAKVSISMQGFIGVQCVLITGVQGCRVCIGAWVSGLVWLYLAVCGGLGC